MSFICLFFQLRRNLNTTKPVDALASVSAALAATCGKQMYSAAMFKLVYDMLAFVGPYLLNAIIKYLQVFWCCPAPLAMRARMLSYGCPD
jgi:hypothetical protein